jgi:hypothetical protein
MFLRPKIAAQTKQCAPAHYHCEATSPGSATVPDVFGGLALSDASKRPGSNAGSLFGLEEQISGEQRPHSIKKKNTTNMLFMSDPRLNRENHPKVCVLPMAMSPKDVLSISCVSDALFPSLKQSFTQIPCFFKSAISLITESNTCLCNRVESICDIQQRFVSTHILGRHKPSGN